VLDIGCGDGFFTKRFLAGRAQQVDAIDIDPTAIERANYANAAPNVRYVKLDAVKDAFPAPKYDVIVWDGALAHFAVPDSSALLAKIHDALTPGGVFVGSESLGPEGDDHLQAFEHPSDITSLFRPFWRQVLIRELDYILVGGFVRREAYWRCSNDTKRLRSSGWIDESSREIEAGASRRNGLKQPTP
jgi:SAM-dependent methyltransferase